MTPLPEKTTKPTSALNELELAKDFILQFSVYYHRQILKGQ